MTCTRGIEEFASVPIMARITRRLFSEMLGRKNGISLLRILSMIAM